ncbi:uncharacterized protein [Euwallacea fornicatus]|uniref:uncharacterized protein n=1 Tax=Euwallacea fornicatus TaxID=995702 RepID=UPI00338E56EF
MGDPYFEAHKEPQQEAIASLQLTVVPNLDEATTGLSQVGRFSVRAPPFWKSNPKTWFRTLESQFALAHITVDHTKYHHVVATVDSEILDQISDFLDNPPTSNRYEGIKARLIALFAESDESRLRKLLSRMDPGDKKPSLLLNEMRSLGGSAVSSEVLKILWTQQLPTSTQSILAGSSEPLDKMANLADKIADIVQPHACTVQALPPAETPFPRTADRMSRLERAVEQLTREVRSRSKSRTWPKRTEVGPTPANSGTCWYHQKFKDKAKKCVKPCSFLQEN